MEIREQQKSERIKADLKETCIVLGGFLCALLLTRVQIRSTHLPLALGLLLGCTLAGFEVYGVLGGIVLGSIVCAPISWHTVCASILFVAAVRIAQRMKKTCSFRVLLLLFAVSGSAAIPLAAIYGAIELLYASIALAIAIGYGYCVYRALRALDAAREGRVLTDGEQASVVFAIGAFLAAMHEMQLFGWSASVSLILTLSALCVTVRGDYGITAATVWSSMLVLCTDADPILIGSVSLGALIAAFWKTGGKPMKIGSFAAGALLFFTILSEAALSFNLQNLLCGMLLYLLIPRAWINKIKQLTDASVGTEQTLQASIEQIEQSVSDELTRLGKLLCGFSGMFSIPLQEDDAVKTWTVQGALTVCRGCKNRKRCWETAMDMQEAILSIAERAAEDLSVSPIDPIDPGCRRFGDLTASVLLAYRQAENRNAICKRVKEQTSWIDRQLVGVGNTLCEYAKRIIGRNRRNDAMCDRIREALTEQGVRVSSVDRYETESSNALFLCLERPFRLDRKTLRKTLERVMKTRLRIVHSEVSDKTVSLLFEQDSDLHARMRVFQTTDTSAVSGDAAGEYRMIGGKVCFALSDGMGRGETARKESKAAIDLLFRLYHAGMDREQIYENVNRLLLAGNDTEMYATLDAVSIDLNSGEAELLKYGAPPSYLIRNGRVKPIRGEALPCGILAEAKPSVIRMKLKANDRLVLCSDGVQDAFSEGTEQTIRSVVDAQEQIGERLLKLAQGRGGKDDMTVMVIRVA